MDFVFSMLKAVAKTGQSSSRNMKENSYTRTGVGGCVESKRYSRTQGLWLGKKV